MRNTLEQLRTYEDWAKAVHEAPCDLDIRRFGADWMDEKYAELSVGYTEADEMIAPIYLATGVLYRTLADPQNIKLRLKYSQALHALHPLSCDEANYIFNVVARKQTPDYVEIPNHWDPTSPPIRYRLDSLPNEFHWQRNIEGVKERIDLLASLDEAISVYWSRVDVWGDYIRLALGKPFFNGHTAWAGERDDRGNPAAYQTTSARHASLRRGEIELGWSLGMVSSLTLSWRDWLDCWREVLKVLPVRHVNLPHTPRIIDNGADSRGIIEWKLEGLSKDSEPSFYIDQREWRLYAKKSVRDRGLWKRFSESVSQLNGIDALAFTETQGSTRGRNPSSMNSRLNVIRELAVSALLHQKWPIVDFNAVMFRRGTSFAT